MKVQVYRDGPARVFATGEHFMVCELNATEREGSEEAMRKLGFRRTRAWEKTAWGCEAHFRRIPAKARPSGSGAS